MSFAATHTPAEMLSDKLLGIISEAQRHSPRSQQVALGPSDLGSECVRKLAFKLLDHEKFNISESWAAAVGTSIHTHIASIFEKYPDEYEVEQRVKIPGMARGGSIDLFIKDTATVVDWKTAGATSLARYKKNGPSHQQIVQMNLYCYGKALTGADVKNFALVFLPTSGFLSSAFVYVMEYDEQIALDALQRQTDIYSMLTQLDLEENPQLWDLVPMAPSALCGFCDWYMPGSTETAKGCSGKAIQITPTTKQN